MAVYRYCALSRGGKKLQGIIDADTLQSAKEKLKKLEMIVTEIDLFQGMREKMLPKAILISFTRELSQLLKAGLPLYESLLTLQEKYKNHKNHHLFLDLCDKIREGKTLSEAMLPYSKSFDPIYIAMVKAGENTGSLEKAFDQLYKIISRGEKFRKQIQSAMIYPAFLLCFCLLLLVGLFFVLVPSMQELLEGRTLHPLTQTILGISKALRAYWIWFLGGGLCFGAVIGVLFKVYRESLRASLVKVPLFRSVITHAVLMRFCKALSVLLSSGVPIVEALILSKKVMSYKVFEDVVTKVEEGLVQGEKLSSLFGKSELIPPLMVRMISTAEETGSTGEMLSNIGEIYEEMLEKSLSQFTNLIQPVMLLVLGIIVGTVLLSVLLPLTDVSNLYTS